MKYFRLPLLFWIVALMTSALLAPRFIPQTLFVGSRNLFDERLPRWLYDNALPRFFWLWANLDGGHYLSIARDGYYDYEYGFFPLYPLAIRLMRFLIQVPFVLGGLIITYLSFWIFLKRFWRLLRLDFSQQDSRRMIIMFLAFPVAFYLLAVYTDSLYLMLMIFCFWFARQRQWRWAGVAGGLAALARFPGIALFPALLVEWLTQEKKQHRFPLWLFLIPLATLGYLFYIQVSKGDWRLFFSSMGVWKQNQYVLPFQTVYRYFKILGTATSRSFVHLISLTELISMFGSVGLLMWGMKKIRPSYLVYAASYLVLPLSSGTFTGMPRYVLHAFPIMMLLALFLKKHPKALAIVTVVFMVLQLVFVAYFSQGHFVS